MNRETHEQRLKRYARQWLAVPEYRNALHQHDKKRPMMRDSHMAMFFLVALLIGSCVSIARAESVTVDQAKEILRLQYTEFCATVKPPPAALMTAVQEGAKAGNTDAQIAFMWLLRIQERYEQNRCGDA